MSIAIKKLINIPVSISILHEQEYKNLYMVFKLIKNKSSKRRAFSEKNSDNLDDITDEISNTVYNKWIESSRIQPRRNTLKN